MTHPREEIREGIVALLKGDAENRPTSAGARVYNSRDIPMNFDMMPAIVVYTMVDASDPDTRNHETAARRVMALRVECYAMGDEAADSVDVGAWNVEEAIRSDPTIGGRVEWCHHEKTEIAFAKEGDDELFVALMDFEVAYWIERPEEPGVTPRLFLGFDPDTGPGNEDDYVEIARIAE